MMAVIGRVGRLVLGPMSRVATPAGRLVVGLATASVGSGVLLGWREFEYLGSVLIVAILLCVPSLFGGGSYGVVLRVDRRLVVGQLTMGEAIVSNAGGRRLAPGTIDIPLADGAVELPVTPLAPGQLSEIRFPVPTDRRGLIHVGPAQSWRGDPLGLLRRRLSWGQRTEIYVHPPTVRLA